MGNNVWQKTIKPKHSLESGRGKQEILQHYQTMGTPQKSLISKWDPTAFCALSDLEQHSHGDWASYKVLGRTIIKYLCCPHREALTGSEEEIKNHYQSLMYANYNSVFVSCEENRSQFSKQNMWIIQAVRKVVTFIHTLWSFPLSLCRGLPAKDHH